MTSCPVEKELGTSREFEKQKKDRITYEREQLYVYYVFIHTHIRLTLYGPTVSAPVNKQKTKKENKNKNKKKGKKKETCYRRVNTVSFNSQFYLVDIKRTSLCYNISQRRRGAFALFSVGGSNGPIGELRSSEKRSCFQLLRSIHLTDKKLFGTRKGGKKI